MHLLDEVAQHLLGHIEVGDHAVLQRPDGADRPRGAAEHPLGLDPDGVNLTSAAIDRDDARLAQDDAAATHVDERVRGPEIDRHVTATEAGEVGEKAHGLADRPPNRKGRPRRWGSLPKRRYAEIAAKGPSH